MPEGVLVCLRYGILDYLKCVYRNLKIDLSERRTSRYTDMLYKRLQEAVSFYFEYEIFGDREICRKLRVIEALYKQYEEMKKREVA